MIRCNSKTLCGGASAGEELRVWLGMHESALPYLANEAKGEISAAPSPLGKPEPRVQHTGKGVRRISRRRDGEGLGREM